MTDNPLDKLPPYNRVSIRAVLVKEGEDPGDALAEAGFAEAVAIPVVVGEQVDVPGGILGDGITPNVTAVLETEQEDDAEPLHQVRSRRARPAPDQEQPPEAVTSTAPMTFGMQPLAPIRKMGG